jgi:phosphonate transport system substrate-binding protein
MKPATPINRIETIMGCKNIHIKIITVIIILNFTIGVVNAGTPANGISIAFFPCSRLVTSFKKFNPLITYLRQETGIEISLKVPVDFEEFERGIKNGDIAFALQDPNIYVKLSDWFDKGHLVGTFTRSGLKLQSGAVIVRRGSGIRDLQDLKGKTVLFGPKLSAPKWLAAKSLFEENGIDLDRDLKSYSNGKCCEDIAFAVYLKAVDAGVVCDHFLGEHPNKQRELGINAGRILILARTQPLPTKVFAACRGVREDIIAKIVRGLLDLDKRNPAHEKILDSAEVGGFFISGENTYREMRLLVDESPLK